MTTCIVGDCEQRAYARGLCNVHYQRWKRLGTTDLPERIARTCLAAGCSDGVYSLRLCLVHYGRLHSQGSLEDPQPRLIDRFMGSYVVDPETRCWEWTGGPTGANGYARLSINDSVAYAHRMAYELFIGPIPEGLTIDHLCRNRACVNPTHLEPVTRAENTRREAAALKKERQSA